MTQEDLQKEGANLSLSLRFIETPFGQALVAATATGICHLSFDDSQKMAMDSLQKRFPRADMAIRESPHMAQAIRCFASPSASPNSDNRQLALHLRATPFQEKVWRALLTIAPGKVASYSDIAQAIAQPKAQRAVGSAIGKNEVAFILPCHRVIGRDGSMTGYRWGKRRKTEMLAWERARVAGP
jgi:AraC family transcriptional regulator of adaptative response/methylated-DNA-[protein]-cysteine methyltransferase